MMTDDDHIFDAAHQQHQQRKAAALVKGEADAMAAELELTRSRRRTSWREAIAIRVAAGQTVERSAAEERYRRSMPGYRPMWMPPRRRAHDLQDCPALAPVVAPLLAKKATN
jgi:hypothetical protein